MATSLRYPKGQPFFDNNGALLALGTITYSRAGTSTLLNIYSDAAGSTALPNPITLNSAGRAVDGSSTAVAIYLKDLGFDYKEVIANSSGTVLYTDDNIPEPVDPLAGITDTAKPRIQYATDTAVSVTLTADLLGSGRLASSGSNSITYAPIAASTAGNGNGFLIKKTSASNTVTFDPDGTDTVDGAATFSWTEDDRAYWFISDGANWQVSLAYLANPVARSVGTVNGLTIGNNAVTPTTQLDVACSEAVLVHTTSSFVLRVGSQALTLNAANTGANGIDTGALANNTWYYIYLISDGTTTASLLSASATAPTMPAGYIYKYRVGTQRTGGSATFLRIRQAGNQAQYQVVAASTTPNYPIMQSGSSGNPTTPTFTTVSVSNFVPPTATRIRGIAGTDTGTMSVTPNNAVGAENSITNPTPINPNVGNRTRMQFDFLLETTNIFYAAGAANSFIAAMGWTDAVNAN